MENVSLRISVFDSVGGFRTSSLLRVESRVVIRLIRTSVSLFPVGTDFLFNLLKLRSNCENESGEQI